MWQEGRGYDGAGGRVPLVLLAGRAGSGKSTVWQTLIQEPGFARTAVLLPDSGMVVLDGGVETLLPPRPPALAGRPLAAVSTGTTHIVGSAPLSPCPCCVDRLAWLRVLRELARWRRRAEAPVLDRMVVEVAGDADPEPVADILRQDPEVSAAFRPGGLFVTIDAAAGPGGLETDPEAQRLAALADRLLITKVDRAGPGALHGLVNLLRGLNPAAPMLKATHGAVDLQRLFREAEPFGTPRF